MAVHSRPTRFIRVSSVLSIGRLFNKIFVRLDIYIILHSKLYIVVSTCCLVSENMCVFGGPTHFADKINTGTTHALQSVVKISK